MIGGCKLKSPDALEARVEALECLLTILLTRQAMIDGNPSTEAALLFKAAYGVAEKKRSDRALLGLDRMFETVMRFIRSG
tara:strand:+ start:269 stop:508 length:240 start_codon:yes stop_codon:yes gene_type:complete